MACKLGVNQTHTTNHVTDSKCKLTPEKVAKIKTLPAERLKVMRWPGGSVSGGYLYGMFGHNTAEAKSSKWQRAKTDPITPFIELSRQIGLEVLVVLNGEDLFDNYKRGGLAWESSLAQQLSMVDRFVKEGVPLAGVEIGNELQIYTGVTGEYNRKSAVYNAAIQAVYDMTEATNKAIKAKYPNLLTGACYVMPYAAEANGRDRQWRKVFANTTCDALIVHHYEESEDISTWLPKLQLAVDEAKELNKQSWLTESMFNFGPGVNHPKFSKASQNTFWLSYKGVWPTLVNGFDIACYHRLSGVDNHPYDLIQL